MQCVVTSPPYWGLRKYAGEQVLIWPGPLPCVRSMRHRWAGESRKSMTGGVGTGVVGSHQHDETYYHVTSNTCVKCGAWRGAYGLEPTVEMYVAHTVEILREVRRVLRADGVCFWNVGDSYVGSGKGGNPEGSSAKQTTVRGAADGMPTTFIKSKRIERGDGRWGGGNLPANDGLKPKDLCLIPFRIALAAQADGWWVRSDIIWAKPNPMPESVTDRPTDAYEHILMLTKSARYFWDAEAVKEPIQDYIAERIRREAAAGMVNRNQTDSYDKIRGDGGVARFQKGTWEKFLGGRNMRNVWTFPTQPYSGAHFATFPEELPRRCIKAATSAKGACRQCGAPWEQVTKKGRGVIGDAAEVRTREDAHTESAYEKGSNPNRIALLRQAARAAGGEYVNDAQTIGWRPGCKCKGQHGRTVPCVVLDPFGGSGTTGRVAIKLNRRAVLLDLAYGEHWDWVKQPDADGWQVWAWARTDYAPLAAKRTSHVQRTMRF